MRQVFLYHSLIGAPAEDVFNWHWKPGAMQRLIPPWEPVEVIEAASGPETGKRARLRLRFGLITIDWVAEHCDYIPGKQFADKQIAGPFAYWHHTHLVVPVSERSCTLIDRVEYELPVSALTSPILQPFVRSKLQKMFRYRHAVTARDFDF